LIEDSESKTYVEPVSLFAPGIPLLGGNSPGDPYAPIRGVQTLPTCIGAAEERTEGIVAHCLRLLKAQSIAELWRVLEGSPSVVLDERLRKRIGALLKSGRLRKARGRPRNSSRFHPLLVYALVEELCTSGGCSSREAAFGAFGDLGLGYWTAKALYNEARNDSRFRGLLLASKDLCRPATDEELRALSNAKPLMRGQSVVQAVALDGVGPATLTISAT
jgi:hypothetical protein